ncbi:peptidoglycan DD-metalloendopeptidase family protein [Candidatus Collierbacteria bacterium]|nr:peptidoglycan DD-metalloendopeptidase family protein [Candidatus Collierbacteria bacterium]
MSKVRRFVNDWIIDFFRFVKLFLGHVTSSYLSRFFGAFEGVKSLAVVKMYKQRGKYATLFVHAGVITVMVLGVALGPSLVVDTSKTQAVIAGGFGNRIVFADDSGSDGQVAGETISAQEVLTLTQVSDKPRSEDVNYEVQDGDTIGSISEKFGVSVETIKWANPNITSIKNIKKGQKLLIPPVTGVVVTVKSGETIYSIAKKYSSEAQAIVDFPFNAFTNDETFALAVGQRLVIPDGVMPREVVSPVSNNIARTPDAGTVVATGNWVWPAQGRITQPYRPWHKGVDIANKSGGAILAADAGTVVVAGWPDNSGYGNRVVINHGNGTLTLYAHMSRIDVTVGQGVNRGSQIGLMGSTGRSTGTHLHFEIRNPGGNGDPLAALR